MKKPAYSTALDRVLFRASRLARELGGAQTGTEHLLLALSQERISQTGRILCYQGAEGRLLRCMLLTRQEPEPAGRQGLSAAAARALDGARHEADRLGAPLCLPEHLLLSLMRDDAYAAARMLSELGVDCNCVFSETYDRLRILHPAQDVKGQSELKLLELYCENMIDRAPQMDPVVGREAELSQLMQVLSRRSKNNPALIRVDMSEYMEPSSVSRLLGAPPGYVGYDTGGTLTEKVRRRPYCVVLFDELEKAHRDITGILLQLLGDGILTDSMGRTVSFKNTIVVMTSNLTGPQTGKPGLGFIPDCADVRAQTVLREAFSPEFLGRIDCVASFRPLAAEDLAKIAALQLRELAGRLQKQNVTLETAPELPERLGALCANEPGGARSLRRRLQTGIEGPAAELLLRDPSVRTLRAVWQQGSVQVKAAGGCF